MRIPNNRENLGLLIVLAAVIACAPVDAKNIEAHTTQDVHLHHIDRDPPTDAAARRVLHRLSEAAVEACGASAFSLLEVKAAARASACWYDSLSDVVARIGSARLTAQFNAQTNRERHAQ